MIRHTAMPKNFRLAAWPYGGAYVTTFDEHRYNFELRPVLEYLKAQLQRNALASTFPTRFTLVNLYSNYTGRSVGTQQAPDPQVMRGPISFTFARYEDRPYATPKFKFWNMRTCIWGDSMGSADFITISLPPDISARARMYSMVEYDQRGLFNITGGFTKAVVRNKPVTSAEIFNAPIPHAMWNYAMSDWQYVLDFWKRVPAMLEINTEPEFLEYWNQRIAPVFTPPAEYLDILVDAYRSFLIRYRSNTMTVADKKIAYLVRGDLTDLETMAQNLAKGVSV